MSLLSLENILKNAVHVQPLVHVNYLSTIFTSKLREPHH
jgi:hypothetical protein